LEGYFAKNLSDHWKSLKMKKIEMNFLVVTGVIYYIYQFKTTLTMTTRTPAPKRSRRSTKEREILHREFIEEIYDPPGPKNHNPKTETEKRQFITEVMMKLLSPRNKSRGWDQVFTKEETPKVIVWLHKKEKDFVTEDDLMYFRLANNGHCGILCLKAHILGDFSFDNNFNTI
jgi:hypothetical protein